MFEHWLDDFWQWEKQYQPKNYLLACSGGMDSMAMMHMLAKNKHLLGAEITVIYINHGWHESAQQWGELVRSHCVKYGLPYKKVDLDLGQVLGNKEALARQARYQAFARYMSNQSVLLTAHHQNDQAETFLINLLRGSGLNGLSAMPARKKFAQGEHWRPFLKLARKEIVNYAKDFDIQYVDDPSNLDTHYTRNWLRHVVIPSLQEKQPQAAVNIAHSANLLANSLDLQQQYLTDQLMIDEEERLCVDSLVGLSAEIQMLYVRHWLEGKDLPLPPYKRLKEWLRQIDDHAVHAQLDYQNISLIKYQNLLTAYNNQTIASAPEALNKETFWQGIGYLSVRSNIQWLIDKQSYWTLYPPGGSFKPINQSHHKPLKEWFRLKKIPPYLRMRTPILRNSAEIIWVGGFGAASQYREVEIVWKK